ncbi:hypothetical protein [Mycoplasma sp. P36-A1]|uniref:hypothetical protein n=1 Tax=Mycoplasma sp. P36-A1 TaxID=3252900 RepID=UPI003C2EAD82
MDNFIKSQSKFVKMIDNCLAFEKLPHAMMIEGNSTFLLDKAVDYLCTRIISDNKEFDPLVYKRVVEKKLVDIIEFDLSNQTLKKENVLEIQKRFSKTALEATNSQIYIIKYIENASSIALNALLKFVEEPNESVYAIFTTQNSEKVLDTIVSRSLMYRLANNNIEQIKSFLIDNYDSTDIDLVSLITHDEVIMQNILDSDVFQYYKETAKKMFSNISHGNFYLVSYETLSSLDKDQLKIYFELFYATLTNSVFLTTLGVDKEITKELIKPGVYEMLLDANLSARLQLESNMNKDLLVDAFAIKIEGVIEWE